MIPESLDPRDRADMTRPSFIRLGAASHRGLHLLPVANYFFASRLTVIDIVAAELSQAALNYPLAFLPYEEEVELVGLLSLEEGHNLFVSASGAWLADCVPASVATYPFRYRSASKGGRPVLLADAASGLLRPDAGDGGAPLFDAQGRPAEKLREVVTALKAYEKSRRLTRKVCWQLRAAGLLVPWGQGSEAPALRPLLRVDEARLRRLGLPELDALRQSGALLLAHAHLISLAGMPRLMRLAQAHATAEARRRKLLSSCFQLDEGAVDSFNF